ncbi:MAG: alpha/beta fold hydrolase [Anaerolineae bacterium]
MTTYVLCHGAFTGGWIWREVAAPIRAAGHEVYTPTFTGAGERAHLANPEVGLDTHIQDILMVFEYEDLHEVILVGYSYSGAVVSGVAERAAGRIAHLVYLDAFVPENGQSQADLVGPEVMAGILQAARTSGDGWRIPHNYHSPHPPAPRRTDLLLKAVLQPVRLGDPAAALPRTFIRCTEGQADLGPVGIPIAEAAQKARKDRRWRYRELKTGHHPWETAPQELAHLLLELAQEK